MSVIVNFDSSVPASWYQETVLRIVVQKRDLTFMTGILLDNKSGKQIQTQNRAIDWTDKTSPMALIQLEHCDLRICDIAIISFLNPCLNWPHFDGLEGSNINL